MQESWRVRASVGRLTAAEYAATLGGLRSALERALQPAPLSELSDLSALVEFGEQTLLERAVAFAAHEHANGTPAGAAAAANGQSRAATDSRLSDEANELRTLAAGDVRRLRAALAHVPVLRALSKNHLDAILHVRTINNTYHKYQIRTL